MLKKLQKGIVKSQVWKSIFRVGIPTDNRKRALATLGNVILHLHPVKVKNHVPQRALRAADSIQGRTAVRFSRWRGG